jgi:hypothetical protein
LLGYPGRDLYAGGLPKSWFTIVAQTAIEDCNRSPVHAPTPTRRGLRPRYWATGDGPGYANRAYHGDQTDLRQRLATGRLGDKRARLTVLLVAPARSRTARGRPRGCGRAAGRSPLSDVAFLPPVCPVPEMPGADVPSPATPTVVQVPTARSARISTTTSAGNALLFTWLPTCFSFIMRSVSPSLSLMSSCVHKS